MAKLIRTRVYSDQKETMTTGKRLRTANVAWLRPLQGAAGPIYRQVAQQVIKAVELGLLKVGDRLPAQRELARRLGVDLTTITRAYTEIRQQGLLEAHGAGGSYIAPRSDAVRAADDPVDLSMNTPPLQNCDLLLRMMRLAQKAVRDRTVTEGLMNYHLGTGTKADREAGASWLEPALGKIASHRVVICPGAQVALTVLLLTQSKGGDRILTENLTYPGMLASARTLGRKITPVESDDEGMLPSALAEMCAKCRPAFIYLTPTIQNPTATTMSQRRREDLYAVACEYRIPIVEDDPHWLLAGDAPAPIATLNRNVEDAPVFYVSTLSKCLAPGLRTAYLIMPPSHGSASILDTLRSLLQYPAAWMTAVATHWIQTGNAYRLLALIRGELAARQRLADEMLPATSIGHPRGLHRWLSLPKELAPHQLIQLASEQGLGLALLGSSAFNVAGTPPNAVRLSLGSPDDREALTLGLRQLAYLLELETAHALKR